MRENKNIFDISYIFINVFFQKVRFVSLQSPQLSPPTAKISANTTIYSTNESRHQRQTVPKAELSTVQNAELYTSEKENCRRIDH